MRSEVRKRELKRRKVRIYIKISPRVSHCLLHKDNGEESR